MSSVWPELSADEQKQYSELTQTERRSLLFHMLYSMYAYNYEISLEEILEAYHKGFGLEIPHDSEVVEKVQSIIVQRTELDKTITPFIENWRFDRLGVITQLILRLAVWELQQQNIDVAVTINEAVELAKCFAEKDAFKFINGVLDKYIKTIIP